MGKLVVGLKKKKNSLVGGKRGVKGVSDSRVFKQKGKIK